MGYIRHRVTFNSLLIQVYSPLDHCLHPLQMAKGFVQVKVERRQARGVNFEFPPGNEHYRQRGVNFAQTVHDLIAGPCSIAPDRQAP